MKSGQQNLILAKLFSLALLLPSLALSAPLNTVGFETGDKREFISTVGTNSVQTSIKRSGAYAFLVNPTTTAVSQGRIECHAATGSLTICGTSTTYFRVYFYVTTAPASGDELLLRVVGSGSVIKIEIRLTSALVLKSYDTSITAMDTGTTPIGLNQWNLLKCTIPSGASVTYSCQLNGVTELGSSGRNLATQLMSFIDLGKSINYNGNSVAYYYDDFAIDDARLPPDGSVIRLVPSANGTTAQWTSGTPPSDYTQVNQTVVTDATYIANAGTNQLHLVSFPTTASLGIKGQVYAVKNWVRAAQVSGSAPNFEIQLKSGGTADNTTGLATLSTTFANFGKVYANDPNTASDWTLPALDALQMGCLETGGTSADKCSQITGMVDFNSSKGGLSMLGVGN